MESKPIQIETARLSPTPSDRAPPPAPGAADRAASLVALSREELQDLQGRIVEALMTCFDPEVPVNIYELGLIYNVEMSPDGNVGIHMTLTSPACPVAGTLPGEVQRKVQGLEGVTSAKVELVWEPPWDKSRMSEAARLQLGIDD